MDFKKRLENIKNAIADIHNIAVDKVLINYEGVLKQRVFADSGAENSKGGKLGLYKSKYYREHRMELGRSGNPINLNFSGELERSIKLVNIEDDRALVVTRVDYVPSRFYSKPSSNTDDVSNYIDRRFNEVFEPTKEEIDDNNKQLDRIIEEEFNKLEK
jgi:hypothetical protein